LADDLENEMRESFRRSEKFLDLEALEEDPLLKQKEQLRNKIESATPEQMQEILYLLECG
jgi:hypothetical protein